MVSQPNGCGPRQNSGFRPRQLRNPPPCKPLHCRRSPARQPLVANWLGLCRFLFRCYSDPVICIDPKGENTRVTMRQRGTFGPVHCLDPFGISGQPSARYNPLDLLDADSLDIAEDAMTLADALVFDEQTAEAHWNEEAKALISGIILYVVCHDEPAHRTLTSVRNYLTLPPDDFTALLTVMQASNAANGLIARAANRHMSKSHREAAGVLSAAQRHTHFLDSPRIAQVVGVRFYVC